MSTPNEPKTHDGGLSYGCVAVSLFVGLLVLGVALFLVTGPNYSVPTDAQLIQEFQQKRPALERLKTAVEKGSSDNLGYQQYVLLLKSVRCGDSKDNLASGPRRNNQGFITIAVEGHESCCETKEKGYAYCPHPPDPKDMVQELDNPPPHNSGPVCYRRLEGNWYLYCATQ